MEKDYLTEATLKPTEEADKGFVLDVVRDMKEYIRTIEIKSGTILFEDRLTLNKRMYKWLGRTKWQVCFEVTEWQSVIYGKYIKADLVETAV